MHDFCHMIGTKLESVFISEKLQDLKPKEIYWMCDLTQFVRELFV